MSPVSQPSKGKCYDTHARDFDDGMGVCDANAGCFSMSSPSSVHRPKEKEIILLKDNACTVNDNDTSLTFLHWNVRGLLSKLEDVDFLSFVHSFDFICLVETFMEKFSYSSLFPDYEDYCVPAVKFTSGPKGRRSGGVVCLVKKRYLPFIKRVIKFPIFCAFVLNKNIGGFDKDILYVCTYIQPEGSPYYAYFDVENGISLFENYLTDCLVQCGDVYILICGDLNSRTSNVSHQSKDINDFIQFQYLSHPVIVNRCSEDLVLNKYGKLLLNVCTVFDLSILNGMCYGDHHGCYTFVSDAGCSVNDYFIMSSDLYAFLSGSCELRVSARMESDHMPVELRFTVARGNSDIMQDNNRLVTLEKFVWNDEFAQTYFENICSRSFQDKVADATNLIDIDIDQALSLFNECIKDAAERMKKFVSIKNGLKPKDWYDSECHNSKKHVRKLLNKFKRTLSGEDRHNFCTARREYKYLLKTKRKQFNKTLLSDLIASIKSQKLFWDQVNKISKKRTQPANNISPESWFNHFKELLERDVNCSDRPQWEQERGVENDYLNRPISIEEVTLAIRKLKTQKAPGPDGIIGELLKYAWKNDLILNFFVKLFNSLFENGIFPENWTESIVMPLYKKGDVNNPNNYRGISLCDVSSKVYSTIINNRLQEWVEENNITGEFQAGFKRNYSTVDHMYTLMAFVQKQFSLNRKLYVAFIDFEKAFDTVNRTILWPILLKSGVQGKLLRCIMSMYACVRAKVRCGGKMTDYIQCTSGVKQGDVCSPILFSLFINELTAEVVRNGKHGAQFIDDMLELFILLLADDVVLLAETVVGLQSQLNCLSRAANSLQLKVNLNKSNIIVFRKGGYLSIREKWTYNGLVMPVVNVYKYLGIYFSTKLSFSFACSDLASRGKRALLTIMQKLSSLENQSFDLFVKLFDCQIQPIILYGAEIWGLYGAADNCEDVHLFALKKFLGVTLKTPNDLVYGETNRFPIYINSAIRCFRYWLKLTRMENLRLPRKAYNMLVNLDSRGKSNWVSKVRVKLYELGFGYVWLQQGVGDIQGFIRMLRTRMIDCRWQDWSRHIQDSDRFDFYRQFNSIHCVPTYLKVDMNKHLKRIMTHFRFGVSDLFTHRYRYKRHNNHNMRCPLCTNDNDNEIHFVLCCKVLNDIRFPLIPCKYFKQPSQFRLSLLMACTNETIVKHFAVFLYKSFKLRSTLCS